MIVSIAAVIALASAIAAWRSALHAGRARQPSLAVTEAEGPRGPDFYIENVGGGVAISAGWYMLTGGEVVIGKVQPDGILRPGERGFMRPILRHGYAERAAVFFCLDDQDTIYVWSYDGDRRRYPPRHWFTPWRREDRSAETILAKLYPEAKPEGCDEAPWQWVPRGAEPKSDSEVLGFGSAIGFGDVIFGRD